MTPFKLAWRFCASIIKTDRCARSFASSDVSSLRRGRRRPPTAILNKRLLERDGIKHQTDAAGAKGENLDDLFKSLKSKSIYDLWRFESRTLSEWLVDGAGRGGPLAVANGASTDKSCEFIKERFGQVVNEVYKPDIKKVDFRNNKHVEVTSEVNSWAHEKTSGLITDILPADSFKQYFDGSWVNGFDSAATKYRTFHLLNGGTVSAPFMTNDMDKRSIAQFDGFKVLELPYKNGKNKQDFAMYIFLPDENDGLLALIDKFYFESGFLDKHIPKGLVLSDQFWIPKFKISSGSEELSDQFDVLRSKVVTEMVHDPSGEGPYATDMVYKSFFEINEEGTIVACADCGASTKRIDFVADHPFLVVIRENCSGIVLSIGQVVKPLEN